MTGNLHLVGKKLRVEEFALKDITPTYVSWLNDPEVTRFSNQRFRKHTLASSQDYFESFKDTSNSFLIIREIETDEAIGTMTVYRSMEHRTADVGIMIGNREFWSGGYGQEAWNLVLDWLLSEGAARKITAGTLDCNIGMIKLMERSGMELEGIRKAQELVHGEPHDILLYGRFA